MTKVTIVIPTYNPHSLLEKCIENIELNTDLSDVEIIVVCNGSDQESADFVLSKGYRLVWYKEAIGFTQAANIGLTLSNSPIIILMNTDTILLPQEKNQWINRLISPFQDPSVGIAGISKMKSAWGDYFPFFCTAISKKLVDKIGLLDMRFSPGYGEDLDYCIRARQAGYEVVEIDKFKLNREQGINIGDFPIYHKGEGSFRDPVFRSKLIDNQWKVLTEKYNMKESKRTLTLSTSINFTIDQIKTFIISFKDHIKNDDLVIFVEPGFISTLREFLYENDLSDNIQVLSFDSYQFLGTLPHNARYIKYLEYLQGVRNYQTVFLADIKDIIFQEYPFADLPEKFLYFFQEDQGIKFRDEPCNSSWILAGYGQETVEKFYDKNIICSGTILGSYDEILKFLETFKQQLLTIKKQAHQIFESVILDQAIVNYLIHEKVDFQTAYEIKTNGDLVGTLGMSMNSPKAIDLVQFKNGKILVNNREPKIIHQYDRYEYTYDFFRKKYSSINLKNKVDSGL